MTSEIFHKNIFIYNARVYCFALGGNEMKLCGSFDLARIGARDLNRSGDM
jgi:hypothetical protein